MTLKATKEWRGRFFEDFDIGDVFRSRLGRTVTDVDNVWFSCLTLNTNQIHFNEEYAKKTLHQRVLVNSTLTLAIVTGLTVADTSENAAANLSWSQVEIVNPVFVGDTLWAESEILDIRPSRSRPSVGIIRMRSRGLNQRKEVVLEFVRTFMVYRRDAAPDRCFPESDAAWTVDG